MNKQCELPGIGTFVPTNQFLKKAMLTQDALQELESKDLSEIVFVLNRQFLDETGLCLPSVRIAQNNTTFNLATTLAADSEDALELMGNEKATKPNFTSIAKVCQTSPETITQLYREILAQMDVALRKGTSIRMNFRIGRLDFRNGEVSWKQFIDDNNEAFKSFDKAGIQNSRYSRMRDHSRISSFAR